MASAEGLRSMEEALGYDPTVVDPGTREAIEQSAGIRLADVDPNLLAFVVDRARKAGNEAFKAREYAKAAELYCQAIAGRPDDFTLFGNRSAAHLALGRTQDAVVDASKAVMLSKKQGEFASPNARRNPETCADASASRVCALPLPRPPRTRPHPRNPVGEGVLPFGMRPRSVGKVRPSRGGVRRVAQA